MIEPRLAPAMEANADSLVGPTHNYSGLAKGNLASARHEGLVSHPRKAALQGLDKMRLLAEMGLPQLILPPHPRPFLPVLRQCGFKGEAADIIRQAAVETPSLLRDAASASFMWAANAATTSASADTADGKVHFTPANLCRHFHRSLETPYTAALLRAIFANSQYFHHHPALPTHPQFGDEGAANHTRFTPTSGKNEGIAFFVYGDGENGQGPTRYPARQTRLASETLARQHGLAKERVLYAQQHPNTIDQGSFHNDVIAVGNKHVLLCHEAAYVDQSAVLARLREAVPGLHIIEIKEEELSVPDAIRTYLFNSQLVSLADGTMRLIVPGECEEHPGVKTILERLVAGDNPIAGVEVVNVRESMQNGGGPACLRLRIVLTEEEWQAVHPGVKWSAALEKDLRRLIETHYREELHPSDIADPALYEEAIAFQEAVLERMGLKNLTEEKNSDF